MLKEFFILLSIILSSSHENEKINIRTIEGKIIEFISNQRITMEINGYIIDNEPISLKLFLNDESNNIYIIQSICYNSTIIKEGISSVRCTTDFSLISKGNYIL